MTLWVSWGSDNICKGLCTPCPQKHKRCELCAHPALLYLGWLDVQQGLFLAEVGCSAVGFLSSSGAGVMWRGGRTSTGHAESVTVQRGRRNSYTCVRGPGEEMQRHALGAHRGFRNSEKKTSTLHPPCKYWEPLLKAKGVFFALFWTSPVHLFK